MAGSMGQRAWGKKMKNVVRAVSVVIVVIVF